MTRVRIILLVLIPIAYLAGSIPFGLIVGLSRGIDPRKAGSGNIGATNVGRLLGGKYFAIVFIMDLCKSLIPMLVAGLPVHAWEGRPSALTLFLWLMVGFAAIMGHMFSIFLKFKGGKGVATSAGVLLGLYPFYTVPGVLAFGVWGIVFYLWRYVSLASMIGAVSFPVIYVLLGLWWGWPVFGTQLPLLIFAVLVAVMIVVKHRSNISRLLAGTEHSFRKTGPRQAQSQ